MQIAELLRLFNGAVEQDVHAVYRLRAQRVHAPDERELVVDLLGRRRGEDHLRRAVFGDAARGLAGARVGDDRLRIRLLGHRAGGGAHGVGIVGVIHRVPDVLVDIGGESVLLGLLSDTRHSLHGVHGVLARGSLAGEHHGAAAVKDGVRHVGNFRTGRAAVFFHAVEHLRGGDDGLTGLAAGTDEVLLDAGETFKRDLHAHIAAGDHDAVGSGEDLVKLFDALGVLDLRNDADALTAVGVEERAHINDVLRAARERSRDVIDVLLDAEKKVALVALGEERHVEPRTGDVHALLALHHAAVHNGAADLGVGRLLHAEGELAVIHQEHIAALHVGGQLGIVHEALFGGAGRFHGGEGVCLTGNDLDRLIKETETDLRALGVEHYGGGELQLIAHLAEARDHFGVALVGAVGEVHAGDVQPGEQELAHDLFAAAGGADGANDLCSAHISLILFYKFLYFQAHNTTTSVIWQRTFYIVFPRQTIQFSACPAAQVLFAFCINSLLFRRNLI